MRAALIVSVLSVFGAAFTATAGVLDARQHALVVPANEAYWRAPLRVECRVRLFGAENFNILVANDWKPSATHWELFTTPGDGKLHVYVPGRSPNHVHTDFPLVDGEWHTVVMVMEERRIRLYVDGRRAADAAVTEPRAGSFGGPLAIGGLVEGQFGCNGLIDEVRITAGAETGGALVGLWRFSEDALCRDESPLDNDGAPRPSGLLYGPGGGAVPGGMPTQLQPLPEPEAVRPHRRSLALVARQLNLESVTPERVRDAVLLEWLFDFDWHGRREYPEHRPGGPDAEKLRRETFDAHALIHDGDGGPLGTVLRRAWALLERLMQESDAPIFQSAAADLEKIEAAAGGADPASAEYEALYLAACAVRREIAFTNPLLDFDSILFAARGTFEGSVRCNPTTEDYQGGHFVTQYFGFNALPGGGIFILRNFKGEPEVTNLLADSVVQNGRLKGRKLDYGAFATPDLSYDGNTVLFAWTENMEHRWAYSENTCFHIFRVDADGSNLVQLTDGPFNDFSPCWLPNGRIAFVSERRGAYIRCFTEHLRVRNYTLFSMRDDGTDIRPMSYFETGEWNPSVNNQGQLVFTRWDYVDRENCLGTRFWISNPDGTNPRAPHGNYPLPFHTFPDYEPWEIVNGRELDSRFGAPLVEMDIRSIPGSPLYIFTAAPHHGSVYGSLCLLDLREVDDGHMSQIKRISPDEPFPETETPGRRHYKYGTPWPLSEDFYLCNVWENLVLLDRYGNKELLMDLRSMPCEPDERLRLISPIPFRARPAKPVIPPNVRMEGNEDAPNATIAVMNVYESDLPFPEDARIKWLRVIQNIPKTNHAMGVPMIGYERENTPRIPLGIVPVEEDGSAYFEAPVAKQLIFQALDENGMAVQSMRSVAFVQPGEQLTCFGCHENVHKSPELITHPMAMLRPPSVLEPECGPIEPVSYYRQIKPIFEQSCMPCHAQTGSGPQDMSYAALRDDYTFWFSGGMFTDMISAYSGTRGGSRTMPGRFGARASKIGQAMLRPPHTDAVTTEDRRQVIQWLDCNSLRLGSYDDEEAQLRGELVWPSLDVDPRNVTGVESAWPPLRRHFWHENLQEP